MLQKNAPRQLDCFTIALGKKTGTTFPITFDNKHNYNALYDTGTSASLINYSAYVSLGQDLDTGYQPFMKNASGEDMGALGQVTCTFTINDQPFTQSFIVCRHMQLLCCSNVPLSVTPFQFNLEFGTTHRVALCVVHPRYPKSNQKNNKSQN